MLQQSEFFVNRRNHAGWSKIKQNNRRKMIVLATQSHKGISSRGTKTTKKTEACSGKRRITSPSSGMVVAPTEEDGEARRHQFWKQTLVAGIASMTMCAQPAVADLNKYEAELGGEFGNGTALQFGEADIAGKDFSAQDLRRSNFTAADCRDCNFKNSKLVGAYFIKSVVARANFENADLSDTLMDRAVIVDANLRNAVLQRGVFTRSDFARSDIYGADFTNALVDKSQQMMMCKYADGVNSSTGVETRKSLNCNSRRQFRASTPSNPDGPQVSEDEKAAFTSSMPQYRE